MPPALMKQIAADDVLTPAFAWLCRRRRQTTQNNEVWDLRWRWADIKPRLQRHLLAGQYRLGPMRRVWLPSESQFVEVRSAHGIRIPQ